MNTLYEIINIVFFAFHIGLIIFNLFGWAFRRLRRWNLLTLCLTAFSWFILGIFYGFGYCFLTDWHWQVRDKLGYSTDSNSYIHFLLTSAFPISISEETVNWLTGVLFFAAFAVSAVTNFVFRKKNTKGSSLKV
jgi:hypothetical protein